MAALSMLAASSAFQGAAPIRTSQISMMAKSKARRALAPGLLNPRYWPAESAVPDKEQQAAQREAALSGGRSSR